MTVTNEFPIGISQNEHRSFTIFVNELKVMDDISKGSPEVVAEIADKDKESKEITVWGCALPLPNAIRDAQAHGWSTTESISSNLSKRAIEAGKFGIQYAGGRAAGMSAQAASSSASQSSGFNVASIAREVSHRMGARQPMVNPNYWQEYRGSDPRTFNFLWDLVPTSQAEAQQILTILRKLKQYSSPKLTALELGLLSPYTFDIQVANGKINDIMQLRNLAIRNIDIDYAADGAVQFHYDGAPKHMTLSIQFVELRTTVADDYDGTGVSGALGAIGEIGMDAYNSVRGFFE